MSEPKLNKYLAIYKGRQLVIEAENSIKAHYQAIDLFQASKPSMIAIRKMDSEGKVHAPI